MKNDDPELTGVLAADDQSRLAQGETYYMLREASAPISSRAVGFATKEQ
jgi:hypothetical protein